MAMLNYWPPNKNSRKSMFRAEMLALISKERKFIFQARYAFFAFGKS